MTSIFLRATTKTFQSNFAIAPKKFFCVFFNRKLYFVLKPIIFENKNLHAKIFFCLYIVVLYLLILDFFHFSLHNFFQKRLKLLFLLYEMFLYALIHVWSIENSSFRTNHQ